MIKCVNCGSTSINNEGYKKYQCRQCKHRFTSLTMSQGRMSDDGYTYYSPSVIESTIYSDSYGGGDGGGGGSSRSWGSSSYDSGSSDCGGCDQ